MFEIIIIVIPTLCLSFVTGYFFGVAVESNRAINEQTEDLSWGELPPPDEPLPYRITEGHKARQELIKNTTPDHLL
jgi:hypothetical protein